MARDLQELEDYLWTEFDAAKVRHKTFVACDEYSRSTDQHPGNYATENRRAMADLAQAIVAVRREIRVEKYTQEQQGIEDEIVNGTRRDVTVLRKLQIKP